MTELTVLNPTITINRAKRSYFTGTMLLKLIFSLLLALEAVYALAATTTSSAQYACSTHYGKRRLHCGTYGAVKHPNVLTTINVAQLNDCRDACESARPQCHTIAYTASSGQCILYKKALGHMGFKKNATSPTQVFNVHCFHCHAVTYSTTYTTVGTVAATTTLKTAHKKHPGLIQVSIPTPAPCDNGGLQYAIQSNPYSRGLAGPDPTYSSFAAQAFQTETPSIDGSTDYVDVPYVGPGEEGYIYGHAEPDMTYLGVNHQGYLFAGATGTYLFNYTLSDDAGVLWTGQKSYSGYTLGNADLYQVYNGSLSQELQPALTFSVNLNQYDYLPIRILWANAGYAARFLLQISGPPSIGVINFGSEVVNPFFAQFSCDGTTAPQFPNFGNQANQD